MLGFPFPWWPGFESRDADQFPACPVFHWLARTVWTTLRDAARLRTSVGEESITDIAMLTLARHCRRQVTVHKFTKAEEKVRGADWEWWLRLGGLWLGMRVQAKRIDVRRQEYLKLEHTVKTKGRRPVRQVNRLILDARSKIHGGPRRIPLYCFYNYFDENPHPSAAQFGCSIASAYSIKPLVESKPVKRHRTEVQPFCHPWHHLVCDWDGPEEIKRALVPSPSVRRTIAAVEDAGLPDYARRLAQQGKNALDEGDPDVDLAGVLLLNLDA